MERNVEVSDVKRKEAERMQARARLWARLAQFRNEVLEEAAGIAERCKEAPAAAIRAAKDPNLQQRDVAQVN